MTTKLHSGTTEVYLASYASGNPFAIGTGVAIITAKGDGIYGNSSEAWTLTNVGTIEANGAGGVGILLESSHSSVTNAAGGLIDAAGTAIELYEGGNIMNAAGATIEGGTYGVEVNYAAGSLKNLGTISGTGAIYLLDGGVITNAARTARIEGGNIGILVTGAAGTIANAGTISGTAYFGIALEAGGTVTNLAGGLIEGGLYGGLYMVGKGTVTNAGTIEGLGRDGIGVTFAGSYADTLIDSGTIIGHAGTAVEFGYGNDRLILDPGAVFSGEVVGGGDTTIELAAAKAVGHIAGLGTAFTYFQSLDVDRGGNWIIAGATNLNGIDVVDSGTATFTGAINGTGTIRISTGAQLEAEGAVTGGETIAFGAASGTLELTDPSGFAAEIGGLVTGDRLDIANAAFAFSKTETVKFTENAGNTGGTLTLTNGAHTLTLTLFGQFAASFRLSTDGHGGTVITYASAASPIRLAVGHG
jgi:hypothetical protein